MSKFYEEIKNALVERQVEDTYNKGINLYFPTDKGIEYPFACDGYIDTKTDNGKVLKLIIEYKFNEMMSNSVARAKVLVQVVYYIKRFEQNGMVLPNVCMVGDKDECFVMHTNELLKYLDEDVDWSVSPSNAAASNPDLVLKISKDEQINPFIFTIDNNFDFKVVADKIKDLAENVKRYVRVTEHNLSKIFDYFCKNVLKGKNKLSGHDLVEIFMGVIGDKMNYYQHPSNPNVLVCNGKNVNVNGKAFESFFSYFERNYTPQETMRLKSIADRLIADADRRMKGDFWTPTIWVDKAHELIEEQLGTDWKEKYVVWDCAWGSGNLTRDYKFKELYCSTLLQSELNIGAEYNQEAEKFQLDFLNDHIADKSNLTGVYSDKLPKGLKDALLENKPIVFFINPPYARSGKDENGNGSAGIEKGGALTKINSLMKNDNMGACSANLYAQFLYRIMKIKQAFGLTNCHIAIFCPTLFLTGQSFKKFRNVFLNEFAFEKAFQFKASEFANVADSWGIGFTLLKNGVTDDKESFQYEIAQYEGEEIKISGIKNVYNADKHTMCSNWVKPSNKENDTITITQKSALKMGNKLLKTNNSTLSFFTNGCNSVDSNTQDVYFMSCPNDRGKTNVQVLSDNFTRCTTLFAARRLVKADWINWADEYLAPNTNHEKWNEFVNDSIVYSLFESKSNQSSLRNVEYKNKKWDIKNEFFWMQKQTIEDLANTNGFTHTYNDARTSKERYVYEKLQTITLSPEAQKVLDKANDIVRNTFKYRELFDSEHPEYQIMNWDCGWYQVKALAKEYDKSEYEEFVKLYKALSDKMRPMVYTLGFLK